MAVQMNTPGAFSPVPTEHNYLSTIMARTLINRDQLSPDLVRRFGDQDIARSIREYLLATGKTRAVKSLSYKHDEEDFIHEIVKCDVATAGATNGAKTLTTQTGYNYSYPSTAQEPYIATGTAVNASPVQVNQVLKFPSGVLARVTAVTRAAQDTFTVYPLVLGEAIPAVTTADEIIIVSNSWGERTGQPESTNKRKIEYSNNIQIIKGTHEVSGSALGEATWFNNLGESGNSSYWAMEEIWDEARRHKNYVEMAMLMMKKTTNTTLAAVSGQSTNITTEGLLPFIQNYGNVENYTIGSWGLTDLENLINELAAYRAPRELMMWNSRSFDIEIDNTLRTLDGFKAGGIVYDNGNAPKSVDFGFDQFTYGGFSFKKGVVEAFDDIKTLGAAGQETKNIGFVIPDNDVVMGIGGTKTTVPSLCYVYEEVPGESMGYKEWITGSAGAANTSQTDEYVVNFRSRCGFEGFAGNRFGLFLGQSA